MKAKYTSSSPMMLLIFAVFFGFTYFTGHNTIYNPAEMNSWLIRNY